MELIKLNAFQVLDLLKQNQISSKEYVTESVRHIEKREPFVGAWAYLDKDLILNSAIKADKKEIHR